MPITIDMTRDQIRKQIREQVVKETADAIDLAVDVLLDTKEIDPTPKRLSVLDVLDVYRADSDVREAIHEEIDAAELVREKELDVGEVFERQHIIEYCENDTRFRQSFIRNLDFTEAAEYAGLAIDDIFSEQQIRDYVLDNWAPREVFEEGDLHVSAVSVVEEAPENVLEEIFRAALKKNYEAAMCALSTVIHEVPDDVPNMRDTLFNARVEFESWGGDPDAIPVEDLVKVFDARVDFREAVFSRLDDNRDGFVEQRGWVPGDLFTKVDLAAALIDWANRSPMEAALDFLGTLSGDCPEQYVRDFIGNAYGVSHGGAAKPVEKNAKAELKALLTKLLSALE